MELCRALVPVESTSQAFSKSEAELRMIKVAVVGAEEQNALSVNLRPVAQAQHGMYELCVKRYPKS